MNDAMTMKLGMERCTSCGHRWIDYEGVRGTCYLCGSTIISECISLREIRESIQALRKEDKKYLDKHAKRTVLLKQRYREIAELSLQRAQEIYLKVKEHYTKGNLSDKVIDQLIVAFRLFSELGIHKSAATAAYMAAMGYAQRGAEKEIRSMEDLNDLVAARQWFMRLGSKDWEAAVNLHIGEKAMGTVSTDQNLLQVMSQVSIWHFYKARGYYYENRNNKMVDRIQFDIERTTQLLTSYTQGASQIEAAKIAAHSTVQHGMHVRKGLESLGQSVHYGLSALGQHIENCGGSLSRAMQSSSQALSSNITSAMYTIAGSSKLRGRSLDRRMSDVGQLISATAREVPEGFFQPIKELGAKFALGAVGSATTNDVTSEPSVIDLADSVLPEVKKSEESLKHLDEPTIKLTGTLLDTLVSKGLGKVIEQLETAEASHKKHE
ncbi:MAG: hypothetical protein HYR76_02930 [Ignavibacteria bacterium]|nr:hypothetical protein [Ignavibacteria bacterium]MBI3764924.1 hypothetical protein [Ignavibacteriales bacterium]